MKVREVIAPVVGETYTVTCLVHESGMIPLSCEAHWDEDINPDVPTHWHIDWRFVNVEAIHALMTEFGEFEIDYEAAFKVLTAHVDLDLLQDVRMVCVRTAPPCLIPSYLRGLKKKYRACSVDLDHPVCPHRGVPLEVNQGTCIAVCQGHGLAWNLRTGKMATTR